MLIFKSCNQLRRGVQIYLFCDARVFLLIQKDDNVSRGISIISREADFNECKWLLLVFISL